MLVPRLGGCAGPVARLRACRDRGGLYQRHRVTDAAAGQVIGGLDLFGTGDSPPVRHEDLSTAQSLADAATIAILRARLARGRELVNE